MRAKTSIICKRKIVRYMFHGYDSKGGPYGLAVAKFDEIEIPYWPIIMKNYNIKNYIWEWEIVQYLWKEKNVLRVHDEWEKKIISLSVNILEISFREEVQVRRTFPRIKIDRFWKHSCHQFLPFDKAAAFIQKHVILRKSFRNLCDESAPFLIFNCR